MLREAWDVGAPDAYGCFSVIVGLPVVGEPEIDGDVLTATPSWVRATKK